MSNKNINEKYDSEIEKLEAEMAEKIAALEKAKAKEIEANKDIKLDRKIASGLWKKGKSRHEISLILEIPNDKNLSLLIPDPYESSVKSHERTTDDNQFGLGGELHHLHETYPCPACYPKQGVTRSEEEVLWSNWIHRMRKHQQRLGRFDEANQKTLAKQNANRHNDIVVIRKGDELNVDVTNIALQTKNEHQQEKIIERFSSNYVDFKDMSTTALQRRKQELLSFIKAYQKMRKTDKTYPSITLYTKKQRMLNAISHELRSRLKGSRT